MTIDANLEKYATPRQWDIYQAWYKNSCNSKMTADSLNIDPRNVQRAIKAIKDKAALKNYSPEHDMNHPVHELFNVHGISGYYGEDGQLKGQWVKTSLDKERHRQFMEASYEALAKDIPSVKPVPLPSKKKFNKKVLSVYPIGDAHIGMKAWESEVGEPFDLEIAKQVHCGAIDSLVRSAPDSDEGVLIDLGDFMHADNMAGVTERSKHSLDMAGRFGEMVYAGVEIKLYMIDALLKKHKHVRVFITKGNHNDTGATWMAVALQQRFYNEPRVTVATNDSVFAYHQFGKTMFGITHGHTCKKETLPSVMATDMPQMWGNTEYRYWYTGHVHHDGMKEYSGCKVEHFRTLAAKDAYASEHGYRAGRDMKCIVLHEAYGEVGRHTVNPAMIKDLVA